MGETVTVSLLILLYFHTKTKLFLQVLETAFLSLPIYMQPSIGKLKQFCTDKNSDIIMHETDST